MVSVFADVFRSELQHTHHVLCVRTGLRAGAYEIGPASAFYIAGRGAANCGLFASMDSDQAYRGP